MDNPRIEFESIEWQAMAPGARHKVVERGRSRAAGSEPLRRWLNGGPPLEKPETPWFRGALTVAHVGDATDPEAHARAADAWARCTWEAYSTLHSLARLWI